MFAGARAAQNPYSTYGIILTPFLSFALEARDIVAGPQNGNYSGGLEDPQPILRSSEVTECKNEDTFVGRSREISNKLGLEDRTVGRSVLGARSHCAVGRREGGRMRRGHETKYASHRRIPLPRARIFFLHLRSH